MQNRISRMKRRHLKLLSLVISVMPTNFLRVNLYRALRQYKIGKNAKIGFNVFVDVNSFSVGEGCVISRNNQFSGPIDIVAGRNLFVGKGNIFVCGWSVVERWAADRDYARTLVIGENCLINQDHVFDVIGRIAIGDGTWLAGFRSQFLAHGASVTDRNIAIGAHSFVGSAVLFCPGSGIGDHCLVGMGSVVTRHLPENNAIVAGNAARILRQRHPDDPHAWEKVW